MNLLHVFGIEELRDLILSWVDPTEVAYLRRSSRLIYRTLSGQEFIRSFNTSRQHAPTWTYIHVQRDGGPGALAGFRLFDRTFREINLQDLQVVREGQEEPMFLADVVVNGDAFTFICSDADFFLFSRIRAGQMPVLIVVNIRSMNFLVVDCPQVMHGFDFIRRRENIKFNVFVLANGAVHYQIVACILDINVSPPLMCVFNSMLKEWVLIERASLLAPNEEMDFEHDCAMFFVSRPFGNAFFISLRDWQPVCREIPHFQASFNNVISVPAIPHAGRWERRLTRHYSRGTEGWAATMFILIDPDDQQSIAIRDVRLYRITPDWRSYELRAVLDAHHLNPPQVLVPYNGITTLESTHEFVQLGMLISVGPNLFRFKLFLFNLASGKWTVMYSDPFGALRVGGPVLTSGLRLTR